MSLNTILQHPVRIAAGVVTAGLLFAAGSAVGSAADTEAVHTAAALTHTDAPVASNADAEILWDYLATLPSAERDQTIIALNPNVSGALEAIVAGNVAAWMAAMG
ncbi:MAG: hypothetical protein WD271_09790 [Acidimicrobiia bacterium]